MGDRASGWVMDLEGTRRTPHPAVRSSFEGVLGTPGRPRDTASASGRRALATRSIGCSRSIESPSRMASMDLPDIGGWDRWTSPCVSSRGGRSPGDRRASRMPRSETHVRLRLRLVGHAGDQGPRGHGQQADPERSHEVAGGALGPRCLPGRPDHVMPPGAPREPALRTPSPAGAPAAGCGLRRGSAAGGPGPRRPRGGTAGLGLGRRPALRMAPRVARVRSAVPAYTGVRERSRRR
jgi:hypothetical protein